MINSYMLCFSLNEWLWIHFELERSVLTLTKCPFPPRIANIQIQHKDCYLKILSSYSFCLTKFIESTAGLFKKEPRGNHDSLRGSRNHKFFFTSIVNVGFPLFCFLIFILFYFMMLSVVLKFNDFLLKPLYRRHSKDSTLSRPPFIHSTVG